MNLTHIRKTQKEIREFKFECVDLLRAQNQKFSYCIKAETRKQREESNAMSYRCQSRPSTAVTKRTERASKRRAESMKSMEATNGMAARNSENQCL